MIVSVAPVCVDDTFVRFSLIVDVLQASMK
jgi:hypothetical protein